MGNGIALAAAGYLRARIGNLAAFGHRVHRVLRPAPEPARAPDRAEPGLCRQSRYARERYHVTRQQR